MDVLVRDTTVFHNYSEFLLQLYRNVGVIPIERFREAALQCLCEQMDLHEATWATGTAASHRTPHVGTALVSTVQLFCSADTRIDSTEQWVSLARHLTIAWQLCLQAVIGKVAAASPRMGIACVDSHGYVEAADHRFRCFAETTWPGKACNILPEQLSTLGGGNSSEAFGIRWTAKPLGQWRVISGEPSDTLASLTKRERSVCQAIVDGRTYRETAGALNISQHTVRNALQRVYRKIGTHNRHDLASRLLNKLRDA
jgi:DNA-binding CsgD family transcriptional regulator